MRGGAAIISSKSVFIRRCSTVVRRSVSLAHTASLIFAVGIAGLASGLYLWQYGEQGLWLPPCAAIGAVIAMLVSHALLSKVMMGVAAIVGGTVGAMLSISRISPCPHSDTPAAPYVVFVGAILGAAIWVIRFSAPRSDRQDGAVEGEETSLRRTENQQQALEYLLISVGSFLAGPILGTTFMLAYHVGIGVEPLDNYPVFGYRVGGTIGALLCGIFVGTIGGAVFGVPYVMAWLCKPSAIDRYNR